MIDEIDDNGIILNDGRRLLFKDLVDSIPWNA